MISKNDLLERSRHQEFEGNVKQHENDAYRVAYAITQNHDDAENVVQDARIIAYKKDKGFEKSKAAFKKIVKNLAIDLSRKKKRESEIFHPIEGLIPSDEPRAGPLHCPEECLLARVIEQQLEELINRLCPLQRAVLLMQRDDHSYEEIAQELDLTLGKVRSHLSDARRNLKKWLQET